MNQIIPQRILVNVAKANQYKYKKPKKEIENWLNNRDIELQSDIFIYPEYPTGWIGVVAAWNRVWIFKKQINKPLIIKDIQWFKGFNKNGSLIFY